MPELDEPIHLCDYDEQWPDLFASEARRIAAGLPADVTIEHIGSTAVPGLLAKPIIDVMLGVEPGLVERGGARWRTNLALRDYLRTNSGAARVYAAAKRSAFESGISSLLAYFDYQGPVIDHLLKRALGVA